jgi:linoleoyl-CoA desaturase
MSKINFPGRVEFDNVLRTRVQNYLKDNQIKETGTKTMQIKGLVCFVASIILYLALVFNTETVLGGFILTFLLIQTHILMAFNVMHDSVHGSFSSKKWLNEIGSLSLDYIGASSNLWKQQHTSLHHTYTNIQGKDFDIDIGPLMRLSPEQKQRPWHRYQHIYAPVLYIFLSLYMFSYSDFSKFLTKKVGDVPLRSSTVKDHIFFWVGKIFYIGYALVLPMFFHNPLVVLGYFLFAHIIFGTTIAVVFQLAHTVRETTFPQADENGQMPLGWVEHQLTTTADFAPNNWFVTFYCGGLNYQVEHHIFHKVSHVHYPQISKIVKETCKEYNKPYNVTPSFWIALKSHFSFLKLMGQN